MYGYCKFQNHFPEQRIDVKCPNYKDCDDNGCVKRHPKTCKNFERNGKCRFKKCAYSHERPCNIWAPCGGHCVEKSLAPKSKYVDTPKLGGKMVLVMPFKCCKSYALEFSIFCC